MFPRMVEWRVANLPKPRFTTEEIIHKRREADALSGQGRTVAAARFAALMGDPCSAPSRGWRFRLPDDATTSVIRMIDHASALRRTRSMDTTHPGSAGRASHGHCSHPPHRLRSRALSRGDLDEPQPDSDRHPTNGPNQAVRYAGVTARRPRFAVVGLLTFALSRWFASPSRSQDSPQDSRHRAYAAPTGPRAWPG